MRRRLRSIGPGAVATAAFIGPGTVTTATVAGAQFGYSFVWALVFAAAAAIALQEMAARLGVVARMGLGEAVLDAAPIVLVGTTIVPYNLFLHAAAARTKWPSAESLGDVRFDTCFSIGIGGIVSILILVTAAATLFGSNFAITSAAEMARQLEPASRRCDARSRPAPRP